MLLKIFLISCLALLASASNSIDGAAFANSAPTETRVEQSVSFETSHKRPKAIGDDAFQTSHQIRYINPPRDDDLDADFTDLMQLQETMNLLPTKERPELNPVLSALINEDVMKSIEAKRAIEQAELDFIKAEIDEAVKQEEEQQRLKAQSEQEVTEVPTVVLTTTKQPPIRKVDLDDDDDNLNVGFIDQTINFDAAGSENNKKSRIQIKKGPNGQDYEYEYVYYYEDDDDDAAAGDVKAKPTAPVAAAEVEKETRGKSRYTNIERNNAPAAVDNSLVSGKAKGRASSVANTDETEAERLPVNTRFPSRGKNVDVPPPTPALDSLENAAERKKISVKRPSLELVDSETFNTDEKQAKGSRNGDTEASKPLLKVEQEAAAAETAAAIAAARTAKTAAAAAALTAKTAAADAALTAKTAAADAALTAKTAAAAASLTARTAAAAAVLTARGAAGVADSALDAANDGEGVTAVPDKNLDITTQTMEKAALDLYAILANENFNMEMTTDMDADGTTVLPGVTDSDGELLTTSVDEEKSSSTTTTTTTTTTTEAPRTTTTTTTAAAPTSLFGRRPGVPGAAGRNRYKSKSGTATTTTTTTEAPAASEPTAKAGRNRFSRPSIGGRNRAPTRTTSAPAPAPEEEEVAEKKEVKPVSSGFGRGRPRNRFNLRGSSTTTERPSEDAAPESGSEDAVSSTTARTLRARPTLNLRGRSRSTTTKAPAATADESSAEGETPAAEEKPVAPHSSPVRPSRFNLNRPGANRLLPRGKLGRTTGAPAADDSAVDSTQHKEVKDESQEEGAEKSDAENAAAAPASHAAGGLNRLKSRPRLNTIQHKTESAKTPTAGVLAPRKVNPLLAKRRLQLGPSTTEAAPAEENPAPAGDDAEPKEETAAPSDDADSAKEDTTEETETTTKQQARGLGLLGQRRRLPLRKPGTIL